MKLQGLNELSNNRQFSFRIHLWWNTDTNCPSWITLKGLVLVFFHNSAFVFEEVNHSSGMLRVHSQLEGVSNTLAPWSKLESTAVLMMAMVTVSINAITRIFHFAKQVGLMCICVWITWWNPNNRRFPSFLIFNLTRCCQTVSSNSHNPSASGNEFTCFDATHCLHRVKF